jgi:His-Xaa-Ser system radical SAM maturase HxsC
MALPLETLTQVHGALPTRLLKVGGLMEFASGQFPVEQMLWDARSPRGPAPDGLRSLPWGAVIVDDFDPTISSPQIIAKGDSRIVSLGDVVELEPNASRLHVRYRRGDSGNVLFATERCNSYCLMCSQPPRDVQDEWRIGQLRELIRLIDHDEPSLAISGGEPTLLGQGLHDLVAECAATLPNTHVHILSNGRRLADVAYAHSFAGLHPSLSWGVPLYGDRAALHDYVVQRAGAFAETLRGLYALHAAHQNVEIRVVLVRPTVERLDQLARFLYRNLPFVEHIAFMGIEPIGFAKAHYETLWVDPVDAAPMLENAVAFLSERGLAVSLYNVPLCTLPRSLWPFARRSISPWKQRYAPECDSCTVRDRCAGFFDWVTPKWKSRGIIPFVKEVET